MLSALLGQARGVESRLSTALALLLAFAMPALAQEGAIAGRVVNAQTLAPVRAAQVFIPGADIGTLTDRGGQYRLAPVSVGRVTVEVRLIGFRSLAQPVDVTSGQMTTLDFELEVSAVQLEDVTVNVVTGLERRRRQLGTNSAQIHAADINKAVIQDVSDFLAGRAEGVVFNDVSGSTGTAQRIRIRGAASIAATISLEPLIVVDGVYFSNARTLNAGYTGGQVPSRLNDLAPEDIENIEVIKGPAAASLYGVVGANGVILITTKRGTPGGTDWHFYGAAAELEDRTDWPLNYSAIQVIGDPAAPVFIEQGFNKTDYVACNNHEAAAGECMQDRFLTFSTLRDPRTTPFQKGDRAVYGVSVSGGTPSATYFISGEYKSEDGVVKYDYNDEEKYSARTNLDVALADELHASLSIGFVARDVGFTNNDNSLYSPILNGIGGMAGFVPGGHPDGPEINPGANPINYLTGRNLEDQGEVSLITQENERLTASVNASWRPLEWLSAQGTFGMDLVSSYDHTTVQPGLDNLSWVYVEGFREASRWSHWNWTGNASLSANVDIPGAGIHSTTTAGASYQEELFEGVRCNGVGLIQGTDSCSSTSEVYELDEDWLNLVTVGAFAQQEFSWNDRLFLTASVRIDDDSNFGGNAPLEAYPSVSLSYLISDEDWFPESSILSELRLRGSWGVAGLRPGFRDAVTLFAPVAVTVDGENLPGVTLSETGNELLEPERSTEWEAGADLGLFGDRFGIGFTYFYKSSKDALIEKQLAPSFGLSKWFFQNLAEVRNKGTEMSLRALVTDHRNVRTNLSLQWTTLDNLIVDKGGQTFVLPTQSHEDGYPAAAFWQVPFTWDDANRDGLLSIDEVSAEEERVFIDEAFPTWTASLHADIELFQFLRVSTLLDARGGSSQENTTERFRCGFFYLDGRGCEPTAGENATLAQQAAWIAARYHGSLAGYLQEAGFVKWREISFTLTAPPRLASKHRLLERLSLTFSGRNLATFTEYPGLDPEVNSTGGKFNLRQVEFNTQPPVRVFTLRLDVRF